jgi:hypothetical protein
LTYSAAVVGVKVGVTLSMRASAVEDDSGTGSAKDSHSTGAEEGAVMACEHGAAEDSTGAEGGVVVGVCVVTSAAVAYVVVASAGDEAVVEDAEEEEEAEEVYEVEEGLAEEAPAKEDAGAEDAEGEGAVRETSSAKYRQRISASCRTWASGACFEILMANLPNFTCCRRSTVNWYFCSVYSNLKSSPKFRCCTGTGEREKWWMCVCVCEHTKYENNKIYQKKGEGDTHLCAGLNLAIGFLGKLDSAELW